MSKRQRLVKRAAALTGTAVAGSQALLLWRQPCWRDAARPPSADAPAHPEAATHRTKSAIVVGAGIAGISTAYRLALRGYEVSVLDSRGGAAPEGSASAAAAGGMETMHKFSTAADWKKMFKQLLPGTNGFRFFYVSWLDVSCDLFFWRWLLRFASESLFASAAHVERKREGFLPVVEWGIAETFRAAQEVPGLGAAAHLSEAGSVMVVGSGSGGFAGIGTGGSVGKEEAVAFEPLLAGCEGDGLRFRLNRESRFGECSSFTRHLAEHCERRLPVRILRGTAVSGFEVHAGAVKAIHTSRGRVEVGESLVVLCAGAWSGVLCDMLGVFCPVYPLKGYTVLVDLDGSQGPKRLVYDAAVYAVPAGPRLRVASVGGLGGWDVSTDPCIEGAVKAEAERLFPLLTERVRASHAVTGLRPYSADEMPLIGRVPGVANVLLNSGPGHTGWKCSLGFAEILAAVAERSDTLPPGASLLSPADRMGVAISGPRLLREARAFGGGWFS